MKLSKTKGLKIMSTEIIKKEIKNVKSEIKELFILIGDDVTPASERGYIIDDWLKLRGKLEGLEFALETITSN